MTVCMSLAIRFIAATSERYNSVSAVAAAVTFQIAQVAHHHTHNSINQQ